MGAGESAATEGARSRRNALRLRRKADYAEKRADDFAKGEVGERMVEAVLSPLESQGWRFLHDRRHPGGGNVDHIAIGPPGVAVLDAKNWAAAVTITPDRRLVASKYDHTPAVDKLNDTLDTVRQLLSQDGVRVAVRGCIVLAGDVDRDREVRDLGDVRVLGIDGLSRELLRARGDLDVGLIDAIHQTLSMAFPSMTEPVPAASPGGRLIGPEAPSAAFEKAQRFYYLKEWKRGGHFRLYLRNSEGESLGWTDVNTGAVTVDCRGDDAKFADVLLAAADPKGLKDVAGELPKVATRLRGGRLLSKVARLHTSVLVGQEWRRYDKHRLYGTLIDPWATSWDLGYVDLKTGQIHPASEGNLSELRGPASRYLEYLHYKLPEPPTRKP